MIARSKDNVPAGRHELRFEFEPTGKPDIRAGKGSPGRAQLYIDKKLVGQIEMAITTPMSFGLGGGCPSAWTRARPSRPIIKRRSRSPARSIGYGGGESIVDDELAMKKIMEAPPSNLFFFFHSFFCSLVRFDLIAGP